MKNIFGDSFQIDILNFPESVYYFTCVSERWHNCFQELQPVMCTGPLWTTLPSHPTTSWDPELQPAVCTGLGHTPAFLVDHLWRPRNSSRGTCGARPDSGSSHTPMVPADHLTGCRNSNRWELQGRARRGPLSPPLPSWPPTSGPRNSSQRRHSWSPTTAVGYFLPPGTSIAVDLQFPLLPPAPWTAVD